MDGEIPASVSSAVEKFESIKIVHRSPLDPPPFRFAAKNSVSPVAMSESYTDSDVPDDLGPPPSVPSPVPSPEIDKLELVNYTSPPVVVKSVKKLKRVKSVEKTKESVKKEPDLSLMPRKSSMKKTKSNKSLLEVKLPGLWFNMNDQYPVENFTGREGILQSIHDVVFGQKSRDARPISRTIALVGKSGMGKTEICRKFAFKFYVDTNGEGNVIWLDGSSRLTIVQGLLRLYEKELKSFDYDLYSSTPEIASNPKETKKTKTRKGSEAEEEEMEKETIQRILRHRIFQENQTLFIFDNVKSEDDIIEFLPNLSPVGHIPSILVTSVYPHNWNNSRIFPVTELEFKEAVDFMSRNLQDVPGFTRFQAEDLAKELYMYPPLLQRAKRMIDRNLETSDWALMNLERNIGLVRRLKSEGIIKSHPIGVAALSVDRGNFYEEDPYVREYDQELRTHPIAMKFHQLESLMSGFDGLDQDVSILAINEEGYVLSLLAFAHPRVRVTAAYSSEYTSDKLEQLVSKLNEEGVILSAKVLIRAVETPVLKTKQHKISPVLDKLRSIDGANALYDLILTHVLDDPDLKSIKRSLSPKGRFVTSMNSLTTNQVLKKVDSKKLEVRIMKHDFPELLVSVNKL